MGRLLSSDEIAQKVEHLDNGILHDTFADSAGLCHELFQSCLTHNVPVGFALYSDQFVLEKCNRTYADYVRLYTPYSAEEALGMSHFDYKPGASPYLEGWFKTIRESKRADTQYNIEIRVDIDQNECISFWDSHLEPISDSAGRLQGFLMCCIDRTDKNVMISKLKNQPNDTSLVLRRYEEMKDALRVIMKANNEDKNTIQSQITLNVKQKLRPTLEMLKTSGLSHRQLVLVDQIEKELESIVSPFTQKLSSDYFGLTPTEINVAGMITNGLTSKAIADVMNVSKDCVDFHRHNIRKKLGLNGKRTNLRSHLSNIC